MITHEEQIAGRCIHFTGIQNKTCKKGVCYDKAFPGPKLGKIPCLKGGSMPCELVEYPTAEAAKAEHDEWMKDSNKLFSLMAACHQHYDNTKEANSKIKCPNGEHTASYVRAELNGHFWIFCKECAIKMME